MASNLCKYVITPLCCILPLSVNSAELANDKDKLSYTLGVQVSTQLLLDEIEISPDAFYAGFTENLQGSKLQLDANQRRELLIAFQKDQMEKKAAKEQVQAEAALDKGKKFLAENKNKPGVKEQPSGLQYKVNEAGKGKSPGAKDTVTVHYRGTLLDGTEFDSSFKRNEPATFQVEGVIAGWQEALTLMKPGAKWQLYIPPELAYGRRGAGMMIGPNETLIFDVELISVNSTKS